MRLIPENNPKPIRITAIVLGSMFVIGGLSASLRMMIDRPNSTRIELVISLFFFVLLGLLAALAVLWMWQLLGRIARRFTQNTADQLFRASGFTKELANTFQSAPYPEADDIVISAYLLTAAEHYKEAEETLIPIDRTALSQRSLAMLNTTFLRIYYMTGRQEKIRRHLETTNARSEAAYDMKPELLEEYKPYLDDELDFALLNAVFAAQNGDRAASGRYMKRAMFRISMRDEADRELYPLIADLSILYAESKYPEAHQLEQRLKGEIVNFSVPLSQPHKDELLRRVSQASVFAPVYDQKAKAELEREKAYAAAMAANEPDPETARRLPTEAELQQMPRPEDNGLELF